MLSHNLRINLKTVRKKIMQEVFFWVNIHNAIQSARAYLPWSHSLSHSIVYRFIVGSSSCRNTKCIILFSPQPLPALPYIAYINSLKYWFQLKYLISYMFIHIQMTKTTETSGKCLIDCNYLLNNINNGSRDMKSRDNMIRLTMIFASPVCVINFSFCCSICAEVFTVSCLLFDWWYFILYV